MGMHVVSHVFDGQVIDPQGLRVRVCVCVPIVEKKN